MYIKRYLEEHIIEAHKTFKILYLGGPRQVGKTTLLLHLAKEFQMNYVTLDDLSARELAKTDPDLFLQRYKAPLFIDEAQYAPELFPYIKMRVDTSQKNGQYWLTGSQQFGMIKNIQESLAGRVAILNLLGFSTAEINGYQKSSDPFLPKLTFPKHDKSSIRKVFENILRGGFPALRQKDSPSINIFFNSYLQTYIDRDLRGQFNITKISEFNKFLQLCAARSGQLLNYENLARDSGISIHAAREWIGILEASSQIYLLKPYSTNFSKRLIKSPKLYFLDTGLACFLTKWRDAETLMSGAMAGSFFETFVVSEVIKSYLYRGEEPPIYYFRDKEKHEVDLIIERNGKIYPMEIKMKSKIDKEDIKWLNYVYSRFSNIEKMAVISMSPEHIPLNREIDVIPAWLIS